MTTTDSFSTYHPVLNFTFFIAAIGMGMFFLHPAFLLCGMLSALLYGVTISARRLGTLLLGLLPLALTITLINPVLNTDGKTVLFALFGRPYTLESMLWGFVTACMFCTVFLWFFSYNAVMTSDKFLYLFGRITPSIALVLTMILRLIPRYRQKLRQFSAARACIGKGGAKPREAATLISALTSWALEGGIATADSMASRGFGAGRRTTFSVYRFDKRDFFLLVWMLVLIALTIVCAAQGGTAAAFVPTVEIAPVSAPETAIGLVSYTLFLTIPTILNISEAVEWRILRSGI